MKVVDNRKMVVELGRTIFQTLYKHWGFFSADSIDPAASEIAMILDTLAKSYRHGDFATIDALWQRFLMIITCTEERSLKDG